MSENWTADARVGVPMMQLIAKQISQCKHKPRAVRQIIDQQWLDEESKQQLRETFHVTDADLAAHEREAANETRARAGDRGRGDQYSHIHELSRAHERLTEREGVRPLMRLGGWLSVDQELLQAVQSVVEIVGRHHVSAATRGVLAAAGIC